MCLSKLRIEMSVKSDTKMLFNFVASVDQLRCYDKLILVHRSLHNAGSQYLSSLLHLYMPSRQLRSVSFNLLSQPCINITLTSRCLLALPFGISSLTISDLLTLTLSSNPSKNSPFLWCKHLWPLAISIHALLIWHNHVDFCILKLYIMLWLQMIETRWASNIGCNRVRKSLSRILEMLFSLEIGQTFADTVGSRPG